MRHKGKILKHQENYLIKEKWGEIQWSSQKEKKNSINRIQ